MTAYVFVDHCAYSVTVPPLSSVRFLTDCLSEYAVPFPSFFVFHPVNFELADEKPLAVRFFDVPYDIFICSVVPAASSLFLSNLIVYVFGVHCE